MGRGLTTRERTLVYVLAALLVLAALYLLGLEASRFPEPSGPPQWGPAHGH